MLLVIKFRIRASLRFLSHAETLKLFQRACVRAGIRLEHSRGYNPHPRLSLPLPRTVGVETEDDLLCLRLENGGRLDSPSVSSKTSFDAEQCKTCLSRQLPPGCELFEIKLAEPGTSFQPCTADYVLTLRDDAAHEPRSRSLRTRINQLLASENLNLQRRRPAERHTRCVDVRPFLKAIRFDAPNITVECKISPAGSIRVDEILTLLDLDMENLAVPIRRTMVRWQEKTTGPRPYLSGLEEQSNGT
jgi:radical SAM-linked protein